jgi:hypothetical protein
VTIWLLQLLFDLHGENANLTCENFRVIICCGFKPKHTGCLKTGESDLKGIFFLVVMEVKNVKKNIQGAITS